MKAFKWISVLLLLTLIICTLPITSGYAATTVKMDEESVFSVNVRDLLYVYGPNPGLFTGAVKYAVSDEFVFILLELPAVPGEDGMDPTGKVKNRTNHDFHIAPVDLQGDIWSRGEYSDIKRICALGSSLFYFAEVPELDFFMFAEAPLNGNGYAILREKMLPDNILQIEILGDKLLILAQDDNDGHTDDTVDAGGQLYTLAIEDGAVERIAHSEIDAISTISCNDDFIAAYSQAYGTLYLLDKNSGEVVSSHSFPYTSDIALTNENVCYALIDNYGSPALIALDVKTGAIQTIGEFGYAAAGLRTNSKFLYTYDTDAERLVALPIVSESAESAQQKNTLTLVNYGGYAATKRMETAIKMTEEMYPEYSIVFQEVPENQLAASLMAQESAYDILFLQEFGGINVQRLFDVGALMSLSDNAQITAAFDELIDMKPMFSKDGQLFAVPDYVIPYAWQINEPLFEELGLEIPQNGWTWEDFFALADKLEGINQSQGRNVMLLADFIVPFILTQYDANALGAGMPEYLSASYMERLTKWQSTVDRGLVLLDADITYKEEVPENTLLCSKQIHYSSMQDNTYIFPPVYADDNRIPVTLISAAINASTKSPEVAAAFLANYISKEALALPEYIYEAPLLKGADAYQQAAKMPDTDYPSKANIAFWNIVLENGVANTIIGDFIYYEQGEWYPQFANGEMTIEQFAAIMQEKAEMALGE